MTYQELCKNGTYIGEVDFHHGGIYAGTNKFYLYENQIFCRHEPTNAFTYDGKTDTFIMVDDVKKNLEKFDRIMYWESNIFGDKEVCDHFFEMMNYE